MTGLLVDVRTVVADPNNFSAVALGLLHKPDSAVAVLFIVPAHKWLASRRLV